MVDDRAQQERRCHGHQRGQADEYGHHQQCVAVWVEQPHDAAQWRLGRFGGIGWCGHVGSPNGTQEQNYSLNYHSSLLLSLCYAEGVQTGDAENHLGALFMRLAKTSFALQWRSVKDIGLTPAQSRALFVLSHCDAPPRMSDLAQRLGVVPRAVPPTV